MLEGLEVTILKSNEFLKDNFDFRLDAEYFLKSNLEHLKTLNRVGYKKISDFGYVTDGIHTSIDYCDDSNVNLFSATTPRENYFDLTRQVFISKKAHELNPRTALKENDIIISTVGTIGNCAVVNKSVLPANSDRHVGIIRLENSDFYPRYISTFLLTKFGRFQTWRESTGNVQLNLFIYRIRTLKIANLTKHFQEKIENLVLLNDEKRSLSKQTYSQAESLLLQEIGLQNFEPSKEAVNIKSFKESFGLTGRLDAEYYQKKYEDYESLIISKSYSFVKDEYIHVITNSKKEKSEYNYIEIGDVNVSDGSYKSNLISVEDLPANAKTLVQKGDILISNVRPYRGAVTIISTDEKDLIVSGAFTVLRKNPNSIYNNEVLKVLLRSSVYKDWLLKFNVGTSYPVIKDDDVLNLPIPFVSEDLQQQIADLISESFKLKTESERLLEVAKKAVEIAIETDEQTATKFIKDNEI